MKRTVVEIACSRCARKYFVEVAEDVPERATFHARLCVGALELLIDFEDLCVPCLATIKKTLETVGTKIKGLSPDRSKKEKPVENQD